MVVAFEGPRRAWILPAGRHDDQDPVLNVYAELYRLPGVDPPDSAGRDKPPCCDESTDLPPVLGAAVAELVERAQKYAGQGASQHSDGNAAPVSPARRCTPSRRPERQDLPALPHSLPALPSCTSTRHRIRASEISRSVTSPREPDTLYPPFWTSVGLVPIKAKAVQIWDSAHMRAPAGVRMPPVASPWPRVTVLGSDPAPPLQRRDRRWRRCARGLHEPDHRPAVWGLLLAGDLEAEGLIERDVAGVPVSRKAGHPSARARCGACITRVRPSPGRCAAGATPTRSRKQRGSPGRRVSSQSQNA